MNFEDWYRENEAYLVAQPFTNYVAAAAWKAGQAVGREQAAKICDDEAAGFGGVANGPIATSFGKMVHEAMAAGAMNCAASIRGA